MAKAKKTKAAGAETGKGSGVVAPTVEHFRADITEVFLFQMRSVAWMTNEATAWALSGAPAPESQGALLSPDLTAADLGLTYERIRSTTFVQTMESLYQYACFGRFDSSFGPMEDESIYTWVTALVADADHGEVREVWAAYGVDSTSARRCYLTAELANARVVLEGGESFYYFSTSAKGSDDAVAYDFALTVRQMALLAGMEEMSIRAAANPKRPNALKTYSDEGRTRIAPDVAKAWLQSKGRYVPIVRVNSTAEVDLAKQGFTNIHDLFAVLEARYQVLSERQGSAVAAKLKAAGVQIDNGLNLDERDFGEEDTMRAVSDALALPADLLVLRAREALAVQQLARVQRQLREAVSSTASAAV